LRKRVCNYVLAWNRDDRVTLPLVVPAVKSPPAKVNC
jgi:hypothetical protein